LINFHSQERPQKLQNSTAGCYHPLQTKGKTKKWWRWCSTQTV